MRIHLTSLVTYFYIQLPRIFMQPFIRLLILIITIGNLNLAYSTTHEKTLRERLSDSVITTKITAKITKDTLLNPLKIYVSTQDGRVKLKGHVRNKEAFLDAIKLVKATKGVRSVNVDQLEIKPVNTAFTDAYITAKVETAILKAKVLDDESIPLVGINAKTENGIVTLSGKVKNKSSINTILKRIKAIKGVKKVNANLKIAVT